MFSLKGLSLVAVPQNVVFVVGPKVATFIKNENEESGSTPGCTGPNPIRTSFE